MPTRPFVRRRRSIPTSRRALKRSKPFGRKKRFSKRKFTRHVKNMPVVFNPKGMSVKLPWAYNNGFTAAFATTGSSIRFQGNGISPLDDSTTITAGNTLPDSMQIYGNFYKRALCFGSSISVEIINSAATPIGCVLLAVPIVDIGQTTIGANSKATLDALNYQQITSIPYAKSVMMTPVSGSKSKISFKMFRKTKAVYDLAMLKDDQNQFASLISNVLSHTGYSNPPVRWGYHLAFYNLDPLSTAALNVIYKVKMNFYYLLTDAIIQDVQAFV